LPDLRELLSELDSYGPPDGVYQTARERSRALAGPADPRWRRLGRVAAFGGALAVVAGCIVLLALAAHSRNEAPAASTPPTTRTKFTAAESQTWDKVVYRPIFRATHNFGRRIGRCHHRFDRGTAGWAGCITPGISQVAATIKTSEVAAQAMVRDVRGDCQAKLRAYVAFLYTSHQRWTAFKNTVEHTHNFPTPPSTSYPNFNFFSPASPVHYACLPSLYQ
jgi:hypothetical protein